MKPNALPGALVISLDFELHWGMRDHLRPNEPEFAQLKGSRSTVTELASLFARRDVHATWATVGFLFASTHQELIQFSPTNRPQYTRPEFDPFTEPVGDNEELDPEHLAGSLIDMLDSTPGQEVASHTFSHFYCLEAGQDEDAFRADLTSARDIAQFRGIELKSLVFPRNQWNPHYASAIKEHGFTCIRGPQPSRGHEARAHGTQSVRNRAQRMTETYIGPTPPPTTAWDQVDQLQGLCDVPASAFLRPYNPKTKWGEPLRVRRLKAGIRDAARSGRIFHLWWHPHNFTKYPKQNFELLNLLIDEFEDQAKKEGMESLSMGDVATIVEHW
jgi:peptidoglycan/xylan/chitin deacetylase (PgdA/CDA1 family)